MRYHPRIVRGLGAAAVMGRLRAGFGVIQRCVAQPGAQHQYRARNNMVSNREELFARVKGILAEMFELDPATITHEARLYEDLDIDSIDAVDLVVRLRELTGVRIESEDFKAVRTVDDVVDATAKLLKIP